MLNIENLSIRQKFAIPLSFIALLVLIVSVLSVVNSNYLSSNTKLLSFTYTESVSLVLNADRDLYQAHTAIQDFLLAHALSLGNPRQHLASYEENVQQAEDRMNQARALLEKTSGSPLDVRKFNQDLQSWKGIVDTTIELADGGDVQQAVSRYNSQGASTFENLRGHYDRVGESVKNQSDDLTQNSLDSSDTQLWYLTLAILLALSACVGSIVLSPRLVTRRLRRLTNMLKELSDGDGDLRSRLSISGDDEITEVAKAFNALLDKLQQMISVIKKDTATLADAVSALNQSAQLSEKVSTQQSNNLDQIATAVNQLSHALQEVANNSQDAQRETEAANLASASSKSAVERSASSITGMSDTISRASGVIQKLATESKNITSLLNVIRDIAEQTNLLALNAAIEAARAGEQGRGFAVVADEVRTLASRTQQATEDINKMVSNLENGVSQAVEAINSGASQMDEVIAISTEVANALQEVSSSIHSANDRIFQIASATEQQSTVVNNVDENISSLNGLSQEAVKAVKDAGQASKHINDVSVNIKQNVDRFSV
ncbi:methyl-accepting chemotaxis protein [Aestuariibacter salexigens]|uniref:methyl-accepting chemotaxis protein n=1 Tax=Aestuariibacter salexigens TaxID=226010 RepID=UPI0003F7E2CB|nr:methyl-accepting chemotaxis protein [Aestuariibacter salexigens]